MAQFWLRCQVAKGMFSDEVTVIVQSQDGEEISAFVPRERVEEANGRVKVRVFDEKGGRFAVLPNENQTVVGIRDSELAAA